MSTKKHVLPATIAARFGITEDELIQSRRRGLFPGNQGYTIVDDGGRLRLVFPADLRPPADDDTAVTETADEPEPEPEEGDA